MFYNMYMHIGFLYWFYNTYIYGWGVDWIGCDPDSATALVDYLYRIGPRRCESSNPISSRTRYIYLEEIFLRLFLHLDILSFPIRPFIAIRTSDIFHALLLFSLSNTLNPGWSILISQCRPRCGCSRRPPIEYPSRLRLGFYPADLYCHTEI